jgi:hypothetical protein
MLQFHHLRLTYFQSKEIAMVLRDNETPRSGEVTGKTVGVYALLWFLGVPGLLLLVLFMFGVGR